MGDYTCTEEDMIIVPVREIPYDYAKKEITDYAEKVGNRTVYVSEIAKELRLDIELIANILYEWREQKCRELCEDDGYDRHGTSYTCPITSCRFNNYLVR